MKKVGTEWKSKDCGVYKITCLNNNKIYVGSSSQMGIRYARHKRELNSGQHYNIHLQRAYNKYGKENFTFEVIDFCDKSTILATEQFYINYLNPTDIQIGYNLSKTASHASGFKHNEKSKAKMVEAAKHKVFKNRPSKETHEIAMQAWRREVDVYYNNEIISTYASAADAARFYSIGRSQVTYACSHLSKSLRGNMYGYTFRYKDGGKAQKFK